MMRGGEGQKNIWKVSLVLLISKLYFHHSFCKKTYFKSLAVCGSGRTQEHNSVAGVSMREIRARYRGWWLVSMPLSLLITECLLPFPSNWMIEPLLDAWSIVDILLVEVSCANSEPAIGMAERQRNLASCNYSEFQIFAFLISS